MATITTSAGPIPIATASCDVESRPRRRRITPQAGRALEILGHSIEYLADESIHRGANLEASSPDTEAIQLLMALNRQIYFECPEIPPFTVRIARALRMLIP